MKTSPRIVIAGVPKAGKTTLASEWGDTRGPVLCTDDLISYGWSEASEEVASKWLKRPGPWVIEGVATARALRKFMASNAAKPCDAVLYLATPQLELNAGQAAMAKGIARVWSEILPRLKSRGVKVYESVEAMQS